VRELDRISFLRYPYILFARMALQRFPNIAVPDAGVGTSGVLGRPS